MENNIFEGAKFGDKFVTEDNKMFIYHHQHSSSKYHLLFPEYKMYAIKFKDDGTTTELGVHSIVSRYQKPIDEEKLDELANEEAYKYISEKCRLNNNIFNELLDSREHGFYDGIKAGYRKAMEE